MVVPTSARDGPSSTALPIWSTPTPTYQGDDLTGAFWADASPGEGVAMRVVAGLADTAIDSLAEDDEGATPTPGAACSRCDAPAQRGTDAVGFRLRVEAGDAGQTSLPPDPPDGHLRPFPGTPMGPRETARYGLRALRIGRPLTRASPMTVAGTWAAFGMLPLSLKGSPGLTSW